MDRLAEAGRKALAAGRQTVVVNVRADLAPLLFFGKVVRVDGDMALVEFDAKTLVEMGTMGEP